MVMVGVPRLPRSKMSWKAQFAVVLAKLPILEEELAWTTHRNGFLGFRRSDHWNELGWDRTGSSWTTCTEVEELPPDAVASAAAVGSSAA